MAKISIPKPHRLADGRLCGQIMVNGHREYVYGWNMADYKNNCILVKSGKTKRVTDDTLSEIIVKYINENDAVLSPSTIRGYNTILNNAFKAYMDKPVSKINWQEMVNTEAKQKSKGAKTVKNEWSLVSTALKARQIEFTTPTLPKRKKVERKFLDYKQIETFYEGIKDTDIELPCLLALHSLRKSEILALDAKDIDRKAFKIHVHGAVVRNQYGEWVRKETNKTDASTRDIPIVMVRLVEIAPTEGPVIEHYYDKLYEKINKVCRDKGLPEVGVHGLRHSFCSLAYHLNWKMMTTMKVGGWSNPAIPNEIYTHLAEQDMNDDIMNMGVYYSNFT